jgi:hypothetical protein
MVLLINNTIYNKRRYKTHEIKYLKYSSNNEHNDDK